MNTITSFGFSTRWRKQCVKKVDIKPGEVVADLLTGMGECWEPILDSIGEKGHLIALDFSSGMLKHAKRRIPQFPQHKISVLEENIFKNTIPSESVDVVISGFGLKTFNDEQLHKVALEVKRILKPGGRFSLIDISVPPNKLLKAAYMLYLKNIIPILGKLFLGNPETYRMLGIYADSFKNSENAAHIFNEVGLNCTFETYFFGCATGVKGITGQTND